MKLSTLRTARRTLQVNFDGESVEVIYKPNEVTPAFQDSLKDIKLLRDVLIAQVVALVDEWDILDEKGKKLKPTPDFVGTLPLNFLQAVVYAMIEDMDTTRPTLNSKKA